MSASRATFIFAIGLVPASYISGASWIYIVTALAIVFLCASLVARKAP